MQAQVVKQIIATVQERYKDTYPERYDLEQIALYVISLTLLATLRQQANKDSDG